MKDYFFLKVWAKNVGAHYTLQTTVVKDTQAHTANLLSQISDFEIAAGEL